MQSFLDCRGSPILNALAFTQGLYELRLRSMNSMDESFQDFPENLLNDDRFHPYDFRQVSFEREDLIIELQSNEAKEIKIFDITKKVKKDKKKADYRKNICGYITKRIIREFISDSYIKEVQGLCEKHKCQYEQARQFYLARVQSVTGPRHLPTLLVAENEAEKSIKGAFLEFMEWFMKERYIRYLVSDGKMSDKKAYIKYKNEVISKYIRTNR